MNPVLANIPAPERPETPCTSCQQGIWYTGVSQAPESTLTAFCSVLGRQVYSGHDDDRTVQTCTAYEPDDE
jgi:hypothetical protein